MTNSRTAYIGDAFDFLSNLIAVGISPAFLIAVAVMIMRAARADAHGVRPLSGRHRHQRGGRAARGRQPAAVQGDRVRADGRARGPASLFQISRLEAADPNAGVGMELQVIAAVVIGGTSLMGGRGSVISTFFGVLIISVLAAGLAQIGANEPTKRMITGAVIVVAVVLDTYRAAGESVLDMDAQRNVRRAARRTTRSWREIAVRVHDAPASFDDNKGRRRRWASVGKVWTGGKKKQAGEQQGYGDDQETWQPWRACPFTTVSHVVNNSRPVSADVREGRARHPPASLMCPRRWPVR